MAAAKLNKLSAHNAAMAARQAELAERRNRKNANVACDDCETEMEFDQPGGGLFKDPTLVTCPGCGAKGTKSPVPRV